MVVTTLKTFFSAIDTSGKKDTLKKWNTLRRAKRSKGIEEGAKEPTKLEIPPQDSMDMENFLEFKHVQAKSPDCILISLDTSCRGKKGQNRLPVTIDYVQKLSSYFAGKKAKVFELFLAVQSHVETKQKSRPCERHPFDLFI